MFTRQTHVSVKRSETFAALRSTDMPPLFTTGRSKMRNDETICFRVDRKLKRALEQIAEDERTTVSQLIKTLAAAHAKKLKKL